MLQHMSPNLKFDAQTGQRGQAWVSAWSFLFLVVSISSGLFCDSF